MAFTSMNMLLKTAMSKLINSMLATNKYTAITNGGIQWPVKHLSICGSSPHSGSISSAKTYKKIGKKN